MAANESIPDFGQWGKRLPRNCLVDRDTFIISRCVGRSIVHLGAADSPFSRDKAASGELLHQKLRAVARKTVGVDLDAASVAILRDEFGIDDILCCDLSQPDVAKEISGEVVVCGDVIEHVNSAHQLLATCAEICAPDGEVIVSTINSLGAKPFLRALSGREAVHQDHVAYYSPSTLGVLGARCGLKVSMIRYFAYGAASSLGTIVFRSLFRIAPQVADGIIVVLTKAL